jgi:very-short-patch-repair endonuclease
MKRPSPAPSGHPLPQGERVAEFSSPLRSLPELAREQQEPRRNQPSPLAGEGVSRRLTGEGFAKSQVKRLRYNMTDAEEKLWQNLRARRFEGHKFRRQVAIGRYIVDFVCFERRLIVEVDGSQHDDSAHDRVRDRWLRQQGFEMVRVWNVDVLKNMDGVLLAISHALAQPSPAPAGHPLPQEERGGGL